MAKKIPNWLKEHPNLFAFLLVAVVFLYVTATFSSIVAKQNDDAAARKKAFCSLIYLFDQSIKLQGNEDLGPMQAPYDQFKEDAQAVECPYKADIIVSTTTTLKVG